MEVYVIAFPVVKKLSNPEDREVPGVYLVEVEDGLSPEKSASVALDIFHSNIGVEVLDDFTFYVSDGEHIVGEDLTHEDYSGEDLGGDVSLISARFPDMNPSEEAIAEWAAFHYQVVYDSAAEEKKEELRNRYLGFVVQEFLLKAS